MRRLRERVLAEAGLREATELDGDTADVSDKMFMVFLALCLRIMELESNGEQAYTHVVHYFEEGNHFCTHKV